MLARLMNVTKRYRTTEGVRDLSLEFPAGEIVGGQRVSEDSQPGDAPVRIDHQAKMGGGRGFHVVDVASTTPDLAAGHHLVPEAPVADEVHDARIARQVDRLDGACRRQAGGDMGGVDDDVADDPPMPQADDRPLVAGRPDPPGLPTVEPGTPRP